MSTYAVGDLQGCLTPLQKLLEHVSFNPDKDKLWLVGDLVNRGQQSLETLRFLYNRRHCITCVLGNHDLHLLAVCLANRKQKKSDTFTSILKAPDRKELIQWLRNLPLVHNDSQRDITLVHAGIPPQWNIDQALAYSKEVESVLKDDSRIIGFLQHMYGNEPVLWQDDLQGWERLRLITNYCTRMRFCTPEGALDLKSKEGPGLAPKGYLPWFDAPERKASGRRIIFGHWASLQGRCSVPCIWALDTGYVWGGSMTMLNVDSGQIYRQDNLGN